MDSGNESVSKRKTRQQSLKYMMEIIENRNRVSQSGNLTNISCGRKRKNIEPSGGDERNVENNGQRKFSPGTRESFTNQPFVEEVSNDGADSSEEESDGDGDVVIISEQEKEENGPNVVREEEEEGEEEEEEEEESDPNVAIIREGEESDPNVIIREENEEESDHDVVIKEEEEESDPDVVIIRENEEEDKSDPDVVIIREEEEESDPDVAIIREEEESDPDIVIIREEEDEESDLDVVTIRVEEEESDHDVVVIREKPAPMLNATYEVVPSTSSMFRATVESKEFTDTTSYSESKFRSSTNALRKNRKKIFEESKFLKFIVKSIKKCQ
ncbi:hypothetical protein KY284_012248 [Solanum tuberosum]|nr:hypothetical protein KY284_012248 [Solanum tuberosum]